MKKHVLLLTGAALLSTSAYATKARMSALGQAQMTGSFYLSDTRNVFRNAAEVNNFKNYVVTEWGSRTSTTTVRPEGGFFREMGDFSYGLYLGNESDKQYDRTTTPPSSARTSKNAGFVDTDNNLDLFFAGDMGVQWGARVHYAKGNNKTATVEAKHSALGLGLGVVFGDASVYANIMLDDTSEGAQGVTPDAGAKWEADTPINVGASYKMNDLTFYADFAKTGYDYTSTANAAVENFERTVLTLGIGKVHEVSSTARVNMDLEFVSVKEENSVAGASTTTETTNTTLPLTIGFEADANSWLTWRGSISQAIIINKAENKAANTEQSNTNTTTVSAGATLNFGKLKVDGTIGGTTAGSLNLNTVLTQVGVHYWF